MKKYEYVNVHIGKFVREVQEETGITVRITGFAKGFKREPFNVVVDDFFPIG